MGVRITRLPQGDPSPPPPDPDPNTGEIRMIGLCGLWAQMLRQRGEKADAFQAQRAALEFGAAAALEKAAHLFAASEDNDAMRWIAAAEQTLTSALLPVPWR